VSHDSDTAEWGRAYDEAKRMERAETKEENLAVIREAGYECVSHQDGSILNFGNGIQFYPSTSKWTSGTKVHYGNAVAFLKWYRERMK